MLKLVFIVVMLGVAGLLFATSAATSTRSNKVFDSIPPV